MANPQKIQAQVKEIVSYGRQVYKVVMALDKKLPRFKAGQFLHLTLDDFDPTTGFWPESRVFSIASCSEDRQEITIVYSVKGFYTRRMEMELEEGRKVWLKAPYGDFIIKNHLTDGSNAVLIAGGTGISPFIPFLSSNKEPHDIQLHYGLRHLDLMIFEKELSSALQNDGFLLNLFIEEGSRSPLFMGNFQVQEGRLSIDKILTGVSVPQKAIFFISGPPEMIRVFKQDLLNSEIAERNIIVDEWS